MAVERAIPVPIFVRVTFAPTTTPLDGSVTVPRSEAFVWPQAPALRTRIPVKSVTQERIVRSLTPHPPV